MNEPKAAISPPESEVERLRRDLLKWREGGIIEVMIRNPQVDEFVRVKEAEVDALWKRIAQIANQTDPAWALKLAQQFIAEREA